eukprot:3693533-Pyramimonas_sp.AAC.2
MQMNVDLAEDPWQRVKIARRGAVFGDIVRMAIKEQGIKRTDEMNLAFNCAAMVKNRRVDQSAYSPRQ